MGTTQGKGRDAERTAARQWFGGFEGVGFGVMPVQR